MNTQKMRQYVTFQYTEDKAEWKDHYSCHAYINGLSGQEFFIANAGYNSGLTVEITCRYSPKLMEVIPTTFRMIDSHGTEYELISPADDIKSEHKFIKFRGRKVTV